MKLFPLLEAMIQPHNFDRYLQRLSTEPVRSIDDLNAIFEGHVRFITREEYHQLNPTASLPENIDVMFQRTGGIGLATVRDGIIYIVYDRRNLQRTINRSKVGQLVRLISMMVRHESIHLQQIERSGGRVQDVDQAGTPEEMSSYMSNKQEMMAYAQSVIDDFHHQGLSNERILSALKQGRMFGSQIYQQFRHHVHDRKAIQLMHKYIYQYLQS
jgi:hypothetical protein